MAGLDLVLRGGTVCTPGARARADVAIRDGVVVQIGGDIQADREIDAAGKLLLPGGVDAHVHLSQPPRPANQAGPRWVDDFTSGSAAALAGGVTSLGNMTFLGPEEGLLTGVAREAGVAGETSAADVFLHPVLASPTPQVLD